MEWLIRGWDLGGVLAAAAGMVAGVVLVVWGQSGFGEVAAVLVAISALWARWQIPPPGRSRAPGSPPDAWTRVGRLVVAVLLVVLVADVAARAA